MKDNEDLTHAVKTVAWLLAIIAIILAFTFVYDHRPMSNEERFCKVNEGNAILETRCQEYWITK